MKQKKHFNVVISIEKRLQFSGEAKLQALSNSEYMEHTIDVMSWLANIIQSQGLERFQIPDFLQCMQDNQQFEDDMSRYVDIYIKNQNSGVKD